MSVESLKVPVTHAYVRPRTWTTYRSMIRESMVMGIVAFLVSFIFALFLVLHYHIVYGDALTRVLNAYYVIFRGNLHVAGIGFVWNPFPSLFELPFVMLHGLWTPILVDGLPANMVSSIFAGISVYYCNKTFQLFGISCPFRIIWSILFMLNPMMLLYGANGMSDSMMIGAFIAATEGALRFYKTQDLSALLATGMWLAVGLGLRYEAVPFATFLIAGLAIAMWRDRIRYSKIEGTVAILLFPIVCAGIVWMILNWMIMHNPLYFLNSQYGNSAQIAQGTYVTGLTTYADGNIWNAVVAAFGFTKLFLPIVITIPLIFLIALFSRRHHDGWIIVLATASVPLFRKR